MLVAALVGVEALRSDASASMASEPLTARAPEWPEPVEVDVRSLPPIGAVPREASAPRIEAPETARLSVRVIGAPEDVPLEIAVLDAGTGVQLASRSVAPGAPAEFDGLPPEACVVALREPERSARFEWLSRVEAELRPGAEAAIAELPAALSTIEILLEPPTGEVAAPTLAAVSLSVHRPEAPQWHGPVRSVAWDRAREEPLRIALGPLGPGPYVLRVTGLAEPREIAFDAPREAAIVVRASSD